MAVEQNGVDTYIAEHQADLCEVGSRSVVGRWRDQVAAQALGVTMENRVPDVTFKDVGEAEGQRGRLDTALGRAKLDAQFKAILPTFRR